MINMYDVHWPYLPREESREQFVAEYDGRIDGFLFRSDDYDASADQGVKGSSLDERDKQHLVDLYAAELFELDREVDRFLGELELGSSTGIVMTSDHGEAFGEALHWEHNGILEPQVRIPLLVRRPPASRRPQGSAPARRRVSTWRARCSAWRSSRRPST